MKSILIIAIAACLLTGCNDPHSAQQRRERMVSECINDAYTAHSPIDCATAADMAIPANAS